MEPVSHHSAARVSSSVFNSKLFTAFFVICFIPLLVEAILIYLHHNVTALAIMKLNVRELVPIDASFFQTFVNIQGGFAFFVALLVGPPLVSRDLRNNALPLYLCRPFSRTEYVMGKMSVILILLSAITWIPQLLLFLFQSYLEGFAWFREQSVDCERDLHRQRCLDTFAGVAVADDLGAGEMACDCECRVVGSVLYSFSVWRVHQPGLSNALGKHHQPRRADEERDRWSFRHVRSRCRDECR